MKKLLLMVLVLLACGIGQAQTLRELYVAIPDSLSPLLTPVNRADFGDFLDNKMKAQVKNRLDSLSEMKRLTADYLELEVSAVSRTTMRLLPVNDSTRVICVVRTYRGPVADSDIAFYDTSWRQLPTSRFLQLPAERDFYAASDSTVTALLSHSDAFLKEATLHPEKPELTFTYTSPEFFLREFADKVLPLLRSPLVYVWKEGRFVLAADSTERRKDE